MTTRRRAAVALACGLATAGPACAASARTFDVPKLLSKQVAAVKKAPHVAVLLPQTIRLNVGRAYASGGRRARRAWFFELDAARGCGGANACFLADFSGEVGNRLDLSGQRVTLAGGRRGVYHPVSCGASCAPASIQFLRGGARYEIQVKGGPNSKSALVALANSALRRGSR